MIQEKIHKNFTHTHNQCYFNVTIEQELTKPTKIERYFCLKEIK